MTNKSEPLQPCMMRWRLPVRLRPGDVLIFDGARELHGNGPLVLGEDAASLGCVFYCQEFGG